MSLGHTTGGSNIIPAETARAAKLLTREFKLAAVRRLEVGVSKSESVRSVGSGILNAEISLESPRSDL
jgi:hypothetical protein